MCQPKDKGGRRCPMHQPASIALRGFMTSQYGLNENQITHTFKGLRKQASQHPSPTPDQYAHFIKRQKEILGRSPLDEKTKKRFERQFDKQLSESELPDGATFYALKKLHARTREQKHEFVQLIREVADHKGVSRNKALAEFREAYGAGDESATERDNAVFDAQTYATIDRLLDRTAVNQADQVPLYSPGPRIERQPTNSNWVISAGYDPDDGRLEVETDNGIHAYHDVPPQLAEGFEDKNLIAVMRDPRYAYTSPDAAREDAVGRWCEDCHKYRAMRGHVCVGAATDLPPAPHALTYEEALDRLSAHLKEEAAEPDQKSQAQLRWETPIEERGEVVLEDSGIAGTRERGLRTFFSRVNYTLESGRGWQLPRLPYDIDVRDMLNKEGAIVRFDSCISSAGDPTVTTPMTIVAAGERGDLTVTAQYPRCDCDAYAKNGRCQHIADRAKTLGARSIAEFCKIQEDNAHAYYNYASYLRMRGEEEDGIPVITVTDDMTTYPHDVKEQGYQTTFELPGTFEHQGRTVGSAMQMAVRNPVKYVLGRTATIDIDGGTDPHYVDQIPVTISLDENGDWKYEYGTMFCDACHRSDCDGIHAVKRAFERIAEEDTSGEYFVGRTTEDVKEMSPADRLAHFSSIEQSTWTAHPDAAEFESAFKAGPDRSYSADLEQYIADYREAENRAKNGEPVLAYTRDNPTNGICAPETGRGFGVELEFDFPREMSYPDRDDALEAIGRELYAAGLTPDDEQHEYHSTQDMDEDDRYQMWAFEEDGSVSGELVSPILYDTPESWEQIEKVCDIIKRNGGVASVNTGGHVHMGLGSGSLAEVERRKVAATQIYSAYQDTLRRVQADPVRKKHRDSAYCTPLDKRGAQDAIYELKDGWGVEEDHFTSFNLGHEGRIEFRGADGSLDPAHIQAQVVTSAAIVSAAERGEAQTEVTRNFSKVGQNAKKLAAIKGAMKTDKGKMTDDELVVSDVEIRSFTDTIMNFDHGRKIMVGIAANTPWQG